ncbi:MAG: hypothetical protein JWO38_4785 [Gemmataceae bacterium]|nr:hypothetical protein [Gemmataceae bacterium]
MPDPPSPRLTLGDLANRVLATTDADARHPLVVQLARGSRSAEQVTAVADRFLGSGPVGRRAFLEWVVRVRGSLPASVLAQITPLLSDRKMPPVVRVAAAARALRALPDRLESAKTVARALTAGLSPLRGLERLRQLQHQLDKSRGLDALIERREQRVKMDCPRCGVRLPRMAMVRHLWHEHGLLMERGKVRGLQRTVEELQADHAATHDTTALDRAAILVDPAALRGWTAATDPPADDLAPLRAAAEEHRAGLCPGCLAELPEPLPPLPAPLALAGGRLAGDGYVVEAGGRDWLRTLAVATPTAVLRSGPDRGRMLGSRGLATLAAGAVLLAAVAAAAVVPAAVAAPVTAAFRLVLAAVVVYGVVWAVRKPPPRRAERAVDAAWTVLARRLVRGDRRAGWLTRLCRTSVGRGDPVARAGVLARVLDRAAAGQAEDAEEALQLLAAAGVLQVEDTARIGRDRIAGVAGLAAAGFRDRPIGYAEYVAGCVVQRDPAPEPGDLARLRVLLLAAAFDAGLRPRDLIDLWAVAPNLRRAMGVEPLHRLGLLYGVWSMRAARRWERVGPADAVYDLARVAPNISGRVLREFPDLLLYHHPAPEVEDQLGPVLVCARGVVVGGQMVADPDADVRATKTGRFGSGYELAFGPHRLRLDRRPPDDFTETVREWLRFRAKVLLPYIDGYLEPGSPEVAARVLGPFRRRCAQCGTVSAVAVGKIGTPVR